MLRPGRILLVTPLVRVTAFLESVDYEEIALLDEVQVFYPIFNRISNTGIPLKIWESPVWELTDQEIDFIRTQHALLLQRKADCANMTNEEYRIMKYQTELIEQVCVLEVIHKRFENPDTHSIEKKSARQAYGFIISLHENFKTHREVAWYAEQANLSVGHFASIVRRMTGVSPMQWISTVTTAYAKTLLTTTDMSIKEISAALNFPEPFTFRKYFKKNVGISPKEYRIGASQRPCYGESDGLFCESVER